jgi:hypothetical protein
MLKRLMTCARRRVLAATAWRAVRPHCEKPCYGKTPADGRQMMDFVDVYFLNYDKHDPYRCDPASVTKGLGDSPPWHARRARP